MAQKTNEENVTCSVQQRGLTTTRRIQLGLDHGYCQTQGGFIIGQRYDSRVRKLLQEKSGHWPQQLDVGTDQTIRIICREFVQHERLTGMNRHQGRRLEPL